MHECLLKWEVPPLDFQAMFSLLRMPDVYQQYRDRGMIEQGKVPLIYYSKESHSLHLIL